MRKNKFFSLLLTATMMVAAAASLTACHDDDDNGGTTPGGGATVGGFNYRAFLYGSGDSKNVSLDSLTSAVKSVESSASWLTATLQPEPDLLGHTVLLLTSTADDGDEAKVTVTAENGERATVTVSHGKISDGDAYNGANGNFITDWWNCNDVQLEGIENPQYVPWNPNASANMPQTMRFQGDPKKGWEMAFCYLNNPSLKGVRYFALYNKWTGQVRLYTYILNPSAWGSDLALKAYFGTPGEQNMYSFYHSMEFGIPTCHTPGTSLLTQPLLVSSQSQTFETWLTPFSQSQSLSPGWYCFEFDLSGYVPKGKEWLQQRTNGTRLQFFPETMSNSNISLKGSLVGKLAGEYTAAQVIQEGGGNATAGVLSALGAGLSTIGGFASSGISTGNAYVGLMTKDEVSAVGQKIAPAMFWGGFACNVVGGLLSYASSQLPEDEATTKNIPGKIDLALDATAELDGYIKGVTGNNLPSLSVSTEGILSANGSNGHLGKGLWGLAEDPVVYIDKEDIISSESQFNLQCKPTGYSMTTFPNYNARIVYAFDPTSVKLNINTELFRDIKDVTVTANVGVFPNQLYGHTDRYRKMLMLGTRPSFSLRPGRTSGQITVNDDPDNGVVNTLLRPEALVDGSYETTSGKDASRIVTQMAAIGKDTVGWQRFYGRLIDLPEIGKQIMVDPQVFIPYTDGYNIGFPTAPDFVVRVDVQFSALDDNGERKYFQFGKLFIPKIQVVGWEDMCKVYSRLKKYSDDCKNKRAVNTLSNDSKVSVRHPNGSLLISKTIRLLDRICE